MTPDPWAEFMTPPPASSPVAASGGSDPWAAFMSPPTPDAGSTAVAPASPVDELSGESPITPPWQTKMPEPAAPLPAVNPRGEALGRGALQGASFGFGDEIYGGVTGLGSLVSGEGFTPGYERGRDEVRANNEAARTAHPWAYGGGQALGGIAATLPMVAAAPAAFGVAAVPAGVARLAPNALGATAGPILPRMVAAGTSSAGLGAVQGFGEGRGGADSLAAMPSGAISAGTLGFLGPVAGAVAGPVAQTISDRIAMSGVPVPGIGRRAANTLADTYSASPAGTIERRVAELGPEAMLGDASPAYGALTQGLATRPEGRSRNIVVSALDARNEGTNSRVMASLDERLGPAPVPSQVEAQLQGIRDAAGPRYQAALENAPPVDTTDVLARLGQRMNVAEGSERAALMRVRDMLVPARGPDGMRVPQNAPLNLHNIKGEIDNLIQYGDPQLGIPPGALGRKDGILRGLRGELNEALERQVPGYADANLTTRTAHRASEAFESGREALRRQDVHPVDYDAAFSAAPIEAQATARLGMRSDLDQVVGNKANDLLAVRGHLKGEGDWPQAKATTTFGAEPVQGVLSDLEREVAFRRLHNEAIGGSNTANKGLGAEAVDVRRPSASGNNSDIALSTLAGGPAGAAGAVGVRAARYGLGYLGRRSDIARNDDLAAAVTRQDGVQTLIDAIRARSDARQGLDTAAGNKARILGQALLSYSGRPEESREAINARSRAMGQYLLQVAR